MNRSGIRLKTKLKAKLFVKVDSYAHIELKVKFFYRYSAVESGKEKNRTFYTLIYKTE